MWLRYGLAILSISALLFFSVEAEEKEHRVRFRWAFGARIPDSDHAQLVSVVGNTTLKTGDQIQLFVEPRLNCFIYVVYISSENEIQLLFPKNLAHFERADGIVGKHYIPSHADWHELDDKLGSETFYLLGSAKRLMGLEVLLGKYQSTDDESRSAVVKQIQDHIRDLRRKHRTLSSPAEKPAAIAGRVRGAVSDIAQFAVDISASDFYAQTFSIDHQ